MGRLVHYMVLTWGVLFLMFQTINADIFRSYQFLRGVHPASLITILGVDKKYKYLDMTKLRYPYFQALVRISGLIDTLLHVCVRMDY